MKEYIDFQATLQAELSAKLRLASRMKRLWGTHIDNGVEVYNEQFTIWPGTETESVKQVLKLFSIPIKDINSQSKDGLTRLYLKLDPNKIDSSGYSKEALATMLETTIPFGQYREFTYTHADPNDPHKFVGWTEAQIQAYVEANVTAITTQGVTTTEALGDETIDSYIGEYVIAEAGVDFTKTLVSAKVVAIPGKLSETGKTATYTSGIQLRYRYKRTGYLDDNSPIVVDMYNDLTSINTDKDALLRSTGLRRFVKTGKTDTLWYNGKMRTESSRLLKKHDYANLVFGSLDFGYDKKKAKGWVKFLTVVLVILTVVVVTIATGGNAAAGAAAGSAVGGAMTVTAALTLVAIYATAITLVLVVYSMILAKNGETAEAAYVGRWVKVFSFVATVTGLLAAFTSLIANAGRMAAQQGATTAAAGSAEAAAMNTAVDIGNGLVVDMSDITAQNLIDGAGNMVTQSFNSSTWLDKLSTAGKVVNKGMEWRQGNLQKDLASMSDECKKQQAALAEEYDKNLHIGIEDIRISTKPLVQANVQFEVDYLYEPTKFNVQRGSFARSGMNIIT